MASGKSTVGARVARALGMTFIDLDDEIVARTGRRIPEIFAAGGEPLFRSHEREALQAVAAGVREAVVAVGGGALAREDNMELAQHSGTVVYLRTSAAELAKRLRGVADRPMLHGEDGRPLPLDALEQRIQTLLEDRTAYYQQAHLTADTSGRDVDEVVAEVVDALRLSQEDRPQT